MFYTKPAQPRRINGLHGESARKLHRTRQTIEANMAFVTDKAELKPGLIIFRRGDVDHRMWYCRMKIDATARLPLTSSTEILSAIF